MEMKQVIRFYVDNNFGCIVVIHDVPQAITC